jgi:hypothetical protein
MPDSAPVMWMDEVEANPEAQLAHAVADFYSDPLGFVMFAFEWGKGDLQGFDGPDEWQIETLKSIGEAVKDRGFDGRHAVKAIREAVSSGHGIGKSALVAWLLLWIMSTRPFAIGTVTANTEAQLRNKTWAELARWHRRCICGHWFEITTGKGHLAFFHRSYKDTWKVSAFTATKENAEAFAGQHNVSSTSFYIFDEASAIPDEIWETAEGGLTDGEPMFFAFGNPTRNSGRFRECFHRFRRRWTTRQIDSRTSAFANKDQIEEWRKDWGEDSDFFRVRVRGVFPSASTNQFISRESVDAAMTNEAISLPRDPLILGVDIARFGDDTTVLWPRKGRDARTYPRTILRGATTEIVIGKIQEIATTLGADHICIDGGNTGGAVVDLMRADGWDNVIEVTFGGKSPDPSYANLRAYMYGQIREAMPGLAIPKDEDLANEVTAIEYGYMYGESKTLLESKKDMKTRGLPSPDNWDALACTYCRKFPPRDNAGTPRANVPDGTGLDDYNPYEED